MAEKDDGGFSMIVIVGIVAIVGIVGLVFLTYNNSAPARSSPYYELHVFDDEGNLVGDAVSKKYCRKRSDCWWDRSAGACRCEGTGGSGSSETTDYTYTPPSRTVLYE